MRTFLAIILWLPILTLGWFQSVGLLQTHNVIRGTGFWCEIYNTVPWWGEALLFLATPILAGIICGFILYIVIAGTLSYIFKG